MSEKFTCPSDHKHGRTHYCYTKHRCRCDSCRAKANSTNAAVRIAKATGQYEYAMRAAAPAREHLEKLLALGYSQARLHEDWGLSPYSSRNVIEGTLTIRRDVSEAILTIPLEAPTPKSGNRVPALGFHRRVQALAAMGWTYVELAERTGIEHSTFGRASDRVLAWCFDRVCEVYKELWDQTPPGETQSQRMARTRMAHMARSRGWLPPLAWDDIDTDPEPPAAEADDSIDEIAVELAVAGVRVSLTPAERRAAVRILHRRRYSDQLIAETLRVTDRTILRIREELHLPGIYITDSLHRTAA